MNILYELKVHNIGIKYFFSHKYRMPNIAKCFCKITHLQIFWELYFLHKEILV